MAGIKHPNIHPVYVFPLAVLKKGDSAHYFPFLSSQSNQGKVVCFPVLRYVFYSYFGNGCMND
jgi:hypothetical protein